mmetsp:Transcript_45901/g.121721  ORF Transcript_45901/g.121721 Transcript_45901/m.121721 type:complete len:211 (-) Transcript_45901:1116-1748(-)
MLCPAVSFTFFPIRRSSHIRRPPLATLRPSASYGTRTRDVLGQVGDFASRGLKPISGKSMRKMSSDFPNILRVIFPSSAVCCKLMHTVPKPPPTGGNISLTAVLGMETSSSSASPSSPESESLSFTGDRSKRTVRVSAATAVTRPRYTRRREPLGTRTNAPGCNTPGGGAGVIKERLAVDVATWSALSPPRLVPSTSTRSAVCASLRIQG